MFRRRRRGRAAAAAFASIAAATGFSTGMVILLIAAVVIAVIAAGGLLTPETFINDGGDDNKLAVLPPGTDHGAIQKMCGVVIALCLGVGGYCFYEYKQNTKHYPFGDEIVAHLQKPLEGAFTIERKGFKLIITDIEIDEPYNFEYLEAVGEPADQVASGLYISILEESGWEPTEQSLLSFFVLVQGFDPEGAQEMANEAGLTLPAPAGGAPAPTAVAVASPPTASGGGEFPGAGFGAPASGANNPFGTPGGSPGPTDAPNAFGAGGTNPFPPAGNSSPQPLAAGNPFGPASGGNATSSPAGFPGTGPASGFGGAGAFGAGNVGGFGSPALPAATPIATPPPASSPERDKELAEATRLVREAGSLWKTGNQALAISIAERALELRTRHLGSLHRETQEVQKMVDSAKQASQATLGSSTGF